MACATSAGMLLRQSRGLCVKRVAIVISSVSETASHNCSLCLPKESACVQPYCWYLTLRMPWGTTWSLPAI